MQWLESDTAVTITMGPFVLETDGYTPVTGLESALDHVTTGITLSTNGGSRSVRTGGFTATTDLGEGYYGVNILAADLGTEGRVRVEYNDATACLPVWENFMVVAAARYEAIVLGTGTLDVNVTAMAADTITASAVATNAIDTNAIQDGAIKAATFAADAITSTVLADNAITAAKLAANAITAAKVATDAIGSAQLAQAAADQVWSTTTRVLTANTNLNDPTAGDIAGAVWDESTTGHTGVGTFGEQLKTDVDAILADTGVIGADGSGLTALATAAALATVDTEVGNIQADLDNGTDGLGALKTLIETADAAIDGVQTDLSNGVDGLGALKALIDTVNTDLSNGTDGLGALKALIDTLTTNVATVDTEVGNIQTDLDNGVDGLGALKTLIDGLNDISGADVLTQVNAALNTSISELGVGAPTSTPTLRTGLMLLYMMARNKLVVQTSGTDALEVYNNAGTMIAKKLLTDASGDYTESEMETP